MTPSRHFNDLVALMHLLRNECAWDKKQTNETLLPYLLEESYEFIDAVHANDLTEIKGELGDVLLQVIFHAEIYQENGQFDIGDVIYFLMEKLIRRHPHIFEKETLSTDEDVKKRWEEIKAFENKDKPKKLLSEVKSGTALMTAQNLQKASAKVGFDWNDLKGIMDKLQEELAELKDELPSDNFNYKQDKLSDDKKVKIENELGDVLFVLTNLARHLDMDAEMVLQKANNKFKRRFGFVEKSFIENGKSLKNATLDEQNYYWQLAKDQEKLHKNE